MPSPEHVYIVLLNSGTILFPLAKTFQHLVPRDFFSSADTFSTSFKFGSVEVGRRLSLTIPYPIPKLATSPFLTTFRTRLSNHHPPSRLLLNGKTFPGPAPFPPCSDEASLSPIYTPFVASPNSVLTRSNKAVGFLAPVFRVH